MMYETDSSTECCRYRINAISQKFLNQNSVVVVEQLLGIYMTVHTALCQTQP